MDRALVLVARVADAPAEALAGLLASLPYGKRLELESRDAEARRASLAGIALALAGLSRLRPAAVRAVDLEFPQGGKPRVAGGPVFSLSHAGDRVAVALAGLAVGFDLERLADPSDRMRLERWTATEAVLKAAGLGLREAATVELSPALDRARLADRDYVLQPVGLGAGCVAHLASEHHVARVDVESFDLSALSGPF
jgi:hypothetical protein